MERFAETVLRGPVRERGLGRRRAESEDIVVMTCFLLGCKGMTKGGKKDGSVKKGMEGVKLFVCCSGG